ncbi:MAG: 3-hydroxyacyl-CoA dehydrogenase/enoyl-CoA hydratase family protein [Bacteroidetes bacterium]|nr:3-hydroxyacyl-CoA dehydrogenase/enoyl-CoA hydratase family protein [Bacteroidota bacterium]
MNRSINKIAILGSGIMGSRIACHFANIGVQVTLLDIVPSELNDEEKEKNLKLEDEQVRNRIVNNALQAAIKSNPAPLYKKEFAKFITTGNFEDDMEKIGEADWTMEVVIEDLKIKKELLSKVEAHRKEGTIITSNTSGIQINLLIEDRSDDFQKHFAGTHFFNPPRYLRLLEIIPTEKTDKQVLDFLMDYGDLFLGKATVECNDTPAFISNRIGIYAIMDILHLMDKYEFTVDEIDALTGPIMGRPKSATFRTCDLVGIDTLVRVANDLYKNCTEDESRDKYKIPAFIEKMIGNEWYGDKTKQGFYKKERDDKGKRVILSLDMKSFEYNPRSKPKFETLELAKPIDDLKERVLALSKGKDKAGDFYREMSFGIFAYVSNRIPEITEDLYKIDEAVDAGFGWELGPFANWDLLGVEETIKKMEEVGHQPAAWVKKMLKAGIKSFYVIEEGQRKYYDIPSNKYKVVPGTENLIILEKFRTNNVVWENSGTTLFDIGDGILNLEFHTKMNAIGGEIIEGLQKSVEIAEKDFRGLVIGNEGTHFSAGANLALMFMLAVEQDFDEIDMAIKTFQNAMKRLRCSSIPVVAAPKGLTLGGGCELVLHTDSVQAAAETYIGLVEVGVGLIPAGGGSKEMAMRTADSLSEPDIDTRVLQEAFTTLAAAKVSTSAHQAFDMGIFRTGIDNITINQNRLLTDAKHRAIDLAEQGYTQPVERNDIRVLGRTGLALFLTGVSAFRMGNYMSDHDLLVTKKLAYVMCGGDLSEPSLVSESYLLDLEREAFLSLLGEKKTLERIESVLKTGKPVRN